MSAQPMPLALLGTDAGKWGGAQPAKRGLCQSLLLATIVQK